MTPLQPVRLDALLSPLRLERQLAGLRIAALASDSRAVVPGALFFAIPGVKADGLAYATDALARGAVAVVTEASEAAVAALPAGLPLIRIPDIRLALTIAATRFYDLQPETIVAVTGTSGKTSVASIVQQIWLSLGRRAASLGTLGIVAPEGSRTGALTTPDPITLHAALRDLAERNITHLAMEASSHGLDQHRVDGVRFDAAAFTNLSRDHLDYHPTPEHYFAAKLRLFRELLPPGSPAVIDADSVGAAEVAAAATAHGARPFTVGRAGQDLVLLSAVPEGFDTRLELGFAGATQSVRLPLAGSFQVSNALVAAGLCLSTGSPAAAVFAALGTLKGAPGRLERVGTKAGAPIFVDYAHKPDALLNVLQTLRPYAQNRLIVVFGCGGDRDAGKRPLMGAIAEAHADVVIVTDDNPRSEDPAAIRAAILAAAPRALEIGDRQEAIETAVAVVEPGDVLVVAGKGHETGQIVGNQTLPFSDREAVAAALAEDLTGDSDP